MKKITIRGILLIVIVILVLLTILKIKTLISCSKENSNEKVITILPEVEGFTVHPQDFENKIRVTWTVLASEEVEIRSEINGIVKNIYMK